jgi:hypothetical protein
VLARQVHADFARGGHVEAHRVVARRRVKPVGPEPLVQKPILEQRLTVEKQSGRAAGHLAERD